MQFLFCIVLLHSIITACHLITNNRITKKDFSEFQKVWMGIELSISKINHIPDPSNL